MVRQCGAIEQPWPLDDEVIGRIPIQQQFTDAGGGVKLSRFHVQIDQSQTGDLGGFGDEIGIEYRLQRAGIVAHGGFNQRGRRRFILRSIRVDPLGRPFGERFLHLVYDAAIAVDDVSRIRFPGHDARAVFGENFLIPPGGFGPFLLPLHAPGGFDVFSGFRRIVHRDVLK